MVTAEEIRARVAAADQERVKARSDAAAKIAAEVERRAKVRAELAEIDAAIMTLAELSEFTGIPVAELSPTAVNTVGGGRRPARRKAKIAGVRKSRSAASDSASPVAVSSDF